LRTEAAYRHTACVRPPSLLLRAAQAA